MNELAIVICNYNKKDFVLGCLESVFRSENTDFDIIVVDNASTDDSVKALNEKYGEEITLIENKKNIGGSGGFNRGMQAVLDRGHYEFFILMDNDITVKKDTINVLRDYMDKHSEVGVCGSAIFLMEYPEITQEMGANISFEEFTNKPLFTQARAEDLPAFVECDYVPIGASIIRTEAIKKAGLIESKYFIYWDDMEFCWRVKKAGYKIHAISSAVIYHYMSSSKYETTFGSYYFFRNKINCFTRHTSDIEFSKLPEIITKRYYRSIICNVDNIPITTTYMHSLNDALNGITGKAEDYKILPLHTDRNWQKLVKAKTNILINYNPLNRRLDLLVNEIKELSKASITIISHGEDLNKFAFANVAIVEKKDIVKNYDLEINLCYHVLDLPFDLITFGEGLTIYYDNFGNAVSTEDEFYTYKNYENGYIVFRAMFLEYITKKLGLIREDYLRGLV